MSKARAYSVDNAPAREEDAVGEAVHSEPNGNLARVYGAPTGGNGRTAWYALNYRLGARYGSEV